MTVSQMATEFDSEGFLLQKQVRKMITQFTGFNEIVMVQITTLSQIASLVSHFFQIYES